MKILVFGKNGQLGRAFQGALANINKDQYDVYYAGRTECDLEDPSKITLFLNKLKPDLIINTAAYNLVDKAETEMELAFTINAKAPEIMALYALTNGATLLHYSTDYIFDGSKGGFYTEDDPRNPLSIYGKSKAEGERAIEYLFTTRRLQNNSQYAIIRVSWLYGDGDNFIRSVIHLAKEYEVLRIITDQQGVPTCAEWLVSITLSLVLDESNKIKLFPSGIYHAVPYGQTTWHGLATFVVQSAIEAGVVLKVRPESIQPILSSEYPLVAPRPMNSRMKNNRLNALWKNEVEINKLTQLSKPWEVLVKAYIRRLVEYKKI